MTSLMASGSDWQQVLMSRLPLYGHRNWIVVADSAYPAQSRLGIETILTSSNQIDVVEAVLRAVCASAHVKANIYTDQELRYVLEEEAPGINEYRQRLGAVLGKLSIRELPHESIIAKLDSAAQMFQILILKTSMTIPYTSVFFELDCAYWSADAETRLRSAIPEGTGR